MNLIGNGRKLFSYMINTASSHLEPLLYAIYINNLYNELVNCKFLRYADDLKLYRPIHGPEDAELLQQDLQRVLDWCHRNVMTLNTKKCEMISFSRRSVSNMMKKECRIGDQRLRRVHVVKNLGVLLDDKLTFEPQINQVISRAKFTLGFIKCQSREFDCPYVSKSLYCALVPPFLEYCSVIWDPVF